MGVNPVWYLDMSQGIHDWLTGPLGGIIDRQITEGDFENSDIAKLAPFIEQMGTHPESNFFKEYWWEREWRHVDDFFLPQKYIVICPEKDYEDITNTLNLKRPFIDPAWSLEQIIGRLAGYAADDIDPF